MSSPKAATARSGSARLRRARPPARAPPSPCRRRAGGAARARPPRVHLQAAARRAGARRRPSTQSCARERGASAASPSGPWARRRRPRVPSAVASATTSSITAAQVVVLGAPQARARGRRGRPASTPGGAPRTSARNAVGRPEITATSAKRTARLGQQRRARPGSGRAPGGSSTMAASVPSKSRNSALRAGSAASGRRSAGRRAAASPAAGNVRSARWSSSCVVARSAPMTTTTSMPVTPLTGVARRERQHLGRLDADGGGDGRRRLLLARGVVDGRGGLGRGRVDRRLHRPAAGADDRRVVRGQPVGARCALATTTLTGSGRPSSSSWSPPLWPALVVGRGGRRGGGRRRGRAAGGRRGRAARPRSPRWSASWSACCSRWGASRPPRGPPPPRRRAMRTAAARTIESEPDVPVCGCSSSIGGPACPCTPARSKPFRWSGRGRWSQACSLGRSARVAQLVEHFTCNALGGLSRKTV